MLRIVYIMAGTPTRAPNNLQVSCHPRPEDDMQPLGLFPRCPVTGPAAPFPLPMPLPMGAGPTAGRVSGEKSRGLPACASASVLRGKATPTDHTSSQITPLHSSHLFPLNAQGLLHGQRLRGPGLGSGLNASERTWTRVWAPRSQAVRTTPNMRM